MYFALSPASMRYTVMLCNEWTSLHSNYIHEPLLFTYRLQADADLTLIVARGSQILSSLPTGS